MINSDNTPNNRLSESPAVAMVPGNKYQDRNQFYKTFVGSKERQVDKEEAAPPFKMNELKERITQIIEKQIDSQTPPPLRRSNLAEKLKRLSADTNEKKLNDSESQPTPQSTKEIPTRHQRPPGNLLQAQTASPVAIVPDHHSKLNDIETKCENQKTFSQEKKRIEVESDAAKPRNLFHEKAVTYQSQIQTAAAAAVVMKDLNQIERPLTSTSCLPRFAPKLTSSGALLDKNGQVSDKALMASKQSEYNLFFIVHQRRAKNV